MNCGNYLGIKLVCHSMKLYQSVHENRHGCVREVHQTGVVKDVFHQCETIVRCAAGTIEPFAVEVGLHQGSAFSPFLFVIMMDSLTENIRK